MNIYEITFSPTGGTKKIADFLAAELRREIKCIDLSNSNEDFHQFSLTNEDTAIVAVPSYSGRTHCKDSGQWRKSNFSLRVWQPSL